MRVIDTRYNEEIAKSNNEMAMNFVYNIVGNGLGDPDFFLKKTNFCHVYLSLIVDKNNTLSIYIRLGFNGRNFSSHKGYLELCELKLLDPDNAIEGFRTSLKLKGKKSNNEKKTVFYRFHYEEGMKYLRRLSRAGVVPSEALKKCIQQKQNHNFIHRAA